MLSDAQSFIMGAVQGLTELLPVSSSAHLVILPWLFEWTDPGLAYDVALHLGTLSALLFYYRSEWLRMGRGLFDAGAKTARRLIVLLIVATIPGVAAGFALEELASTTFRAPILVAVALAVMGAVLLAADRYGSQKRTIGEMTIWDALLIGASQALAIVPGVSRSGVTITMGRIVGLNRQEAANFSFLMATPIIAGAGLFEARKLGQLSLDSQLAWGFVASAAFSLLAIWGLIRYVRTRSYAPFVWYRFALAALIIGIALARG